MDQVGEVDNAIPVEAWNTILFDKFARFRWQRVHGLSGYGACLFERLFSIFY